ncbi:MAG: hypothetical protein KKB31_02015 [Nanoarchaeota archaeon]|nr:hypothetical protein [Nanoarchaeota archaeon]
MKKQKSKLNFVMAMGVLILLVAGTVFAQPLFDKDKGYKPLPLPEYSDPLPSEEDPSVVVGYEIPVEPPVGYDVPRLSFMVSPNQQVTDDGSAVYKLVFKDLHKPIPPCDPEPGMACALGFPVYNYKLKFYAVEDRTYGKFSEESFTLVGGESKTITLNVETKNKGTSYFVVTAFDMDGKSLSRKASITYERVIEPGPIDPFYFVGSGYMENSGEGILVAFNIKDNNKYGLVGKTQIDGEYYYVKGNVVGASESSSGMHLDMVEFNVISMDNGDVLGIFKGSLFYYDGFKVMKGILYDFQGKNWDLITFEKDHDRTPAVLIDPIEVTTEALTGYMGEVISMGKTPYFW